MRSWPAVRRERRQSERRSSKNILSQLTVGRRGPRCSDSPETEKPRVFFSLRSEEQNSLAGTRVWMSPPRNIAAGTDTFRIVKPRSLASVNAPGLSLKMPDLKSCGVEKVTSCVESATSSIKSWRD